MYLTSYLCNYFQLVALLFNQLCIQTELIARPAGTSRSESFSRCAYLFILPVGLEEKNSQRLSRLEPTSHEKESNRRGFYITQAKRVGDWLGEPISERVEDAVSHRVPTSTSTNWDWSVCFRWCEEPLLADQSNKLMKTHRLTLKAPSNQRHH